jgi:hypothetical protein
VKKAYVKPKKAANSGFSVHHYAGVVGYKIAGFVDMNRDETSEDITLLFEQETGFTQLKKLALAEAAEKAAAAGGGKGPGKGGKAGKPTTVSRAFTKQLEQLADRLRATTKQYVRCIKPNQTLQPRDFDFEFMRRQLEYSGLIEVALVRQAGFAHHWGHEAFWNHFHLAVPSTGDEQATVRSRRKSVVKKDPKSEVKQLCKVLEMHEDDFKIGNTVIFFSEPCHKVRGAHALTPSRPRPHALTPSPSPSRPHALTPSRRRPHALTLSRSHPHLHLHTLIVPRLPGCRALSLALTICRTAPPVPLHRPSTAPPPPLHRPSSCAGAHGEAQRDAEERTACARHGDRRAKLHRQEEGQAARQVPRARREARQGGGGSRGGGGGSGGVGR